MIILVTGATHTGKTRLAQKMLEKYQFPYVCQDHIKMGLIRSGYTDLTPSDDDRMTDYLWPVTAEMAKTAIENHQNMIIEGCYIPFDWKKSFTEEYLQHIRYVCLCLSDSYIDKNYALVERYASCIEQRLCDDCSIELIRRDNRRFREGCEAQGLPYILIREDYETEMEKAFL